MGRVPCCDKANVKRGPWSLEEDAILRDYLQKHGNGGNWISLPLKAGLRRCGKSCRLRWLNYLRPNIKHGGFTEEEDNIICRLYTSLGSKWSKIASHLSGRTDNDVKNHWNTKLKKKLMALRVTTNIPERENPNSASFQVSIPDFLPQLNNNMGFYDQYCPLPGLFVEVPPASGGFSEQAESSTRADLFPILSRDAAATGGSDINERGSWSSVGGTALDGDLGAGSTSSPDFGFDPEDYELLYGLGFYDNSIELDDFNKTLF